MCLILFAYHCHPEFPLIVAANRDEFYSRPTRAPHFWEDCPDIFAGRDLQAGGTWMGVSRGGRFAAVTNYREGQATPTNKTSRGELCSRFLDADIDPQEYLAELAQRPDAYAGYNLLAGDFSDPQSPRLGYFSNRPHTPATRLPAGIYGLSNGVLDEPWPKVSSGKQQLQQRLQQDPEQIQQILLDGTTADFSQLPDTGIEKSLEEKLSSRFIKMEDYGTRNSTVIRIHRSGEVQWLEQQFGPNGTPAEQRAYRFQLQIKP